MNIETTIQKITAYEPTELFGADKAESIIAEIRAEAMSYAPDLSTDASRKQIASVAAKVAKAKVAIDAIGKKLVDPIKAQAKVIDAERRIYKDELDALKEEVRAPLTEWENEQNRIEAERKQRVFELEQCCVTTNASTGEVLPIDRLQAQLTHLEDAEPTEAIYGPHKEMAEGIIHKGIIALRAAIKTRKVLDRDAKEQAAAEAETPEQRAEREQAIRDKAAEEERAKIEAENKRKLAEEEKRLADAEHVRKVKTEAWQSLRESVRGVDVVCKVDDETLADIIRAIADGKVKHVSIQF